jgi:hypothetical protein
MLVAVIVVWVVVMPVCVTVTAPQCCVQCGPGGAGGNSKEFVWQAVPVQNSGCH